MSSAEERLYEFHIPQREPQQTIHTDNIRSRDLVIAWCPIKTFVQSSVLTVFITHNRGAIPMQVNNEAAHAESIYLVHL